MAEQKGKPEEGVESRPKSSRLLLILVIVLLVLVLGMGGVVLYVLGVVPGFKAKTEEESAEEPAVEEQVAAPRAPLFAPLDPAFVVNLPPGSDARLMQIGLTALTYDPLVVDALKKHAPMLRNNLNLLFSGQDAAKLRTLEGKQELQGKVLEEVRKVAQLQVPKGTVEQVFFTGYVLQ